MQDDLNRPLKGRAASPPLGARIRPVAVWGGRLAVVAVVIAAGALYERGAFAPRPAEIAVIPFSAVKTVAPTPTPTVVVATAVPQVFPPAAGGGVATVARDSGHGPQIIDVAAALAGRADAGARDAVNVDRRLVESSKFGPLPRIGADGARPSEVYARPFAETPVTRGAPRIAVFVGGLGLDSQTTQAAIARLPGGVSLGLAPYGGDLAHVAESARAAGHEVWLQAPMEGVGDAEPGPHALKTAASAAANQDSLHWQMGRFQGYVGVANYLGAKFTADTDALSPVLAEIARRGLLYLDDGSSALSKAGDLASGLDLKATRADTIAEGGGDAIEAALAGAEEIARRRGAAIVVSTALPQSLDHVARWAAGAGGQRVRARAGVGAGRASGPRRAGQPVSANPHLGYRPCAGIALFNRDGDVFVGKRRHERGAPLGGHEWQMPQGGIDEGEGAAAAARRELYEETNVATATLVAEAPAWLAYDLPATARSRFGGRYRGQTQKWFLFRFEGAESEIDIDAPAGGQHRPEFAAWRWERWEALPDLVVPFKREVYAQVVAWFTPLARQRPA